MPMDRSLYPKDWKWIALKVKEDADWCCQECGRPCKQPEESWEDFEVRVFAQVDCRWLIDQYYDEVYDEELGLVQVARHGRFVLTVAHLNHIPSDCRPENLKALCAPCHCRYDLKQMERKRRIKKELHGQLVIPGT